MDWRIGIEQEAGREHAWTAIGMRCGEMSDQSFSDDLVAGIADAGDAGGKKRRQYLVGSDMGEIQAMYQMDMAIDQAGNDEQLSGVDDASVLGDFERRLRSTDGSDRFRFNQDRAIGQHLARD